MLGNIMVEKLVLLFRCQLVYHERGRAFPDVVCYNVQEATGTLLGNWRRLVSLDRKWRNM